jgi:hypothetical protein
MTPNAASATSLLSRPLLVRFVSIASSAASFYLLLSCVPLYARSAGASAGLAGLATSALTLASVAAYLVAQRRENTHNQRSAHQSPFGIMPFHLSREMTGNRPGKPVRRPGWGAVPSNLD